MKFIPAIDLKDNKCVRLERGKEEDLTVFNQNPIEQAQFFQEKGCERIHIVDLDGAFGRPDINKNTIIQIRKNTNIPIEFGGGIKNEKDISYWFDEGIDFLIVGSLAIKNTELIITAAKKFTNQIYVALDIFKNEVMIKGWVEGSNFSADDIFNAFNNTSIKGFILTDISRDGMLEGLDFKLIESTIHKTSKKVIVGGGLSSYDDLYNLNKLSLYNLEGVIAGKSFYSGNISIYKALKILKEHA